MRRTLSGMGELRQGGAGPAMKGEKREGKREKGAGAVVWEGKGEG